ncbi:MAG: putative transposase YbfD/YdcC [Cocleimonas sp.]|jgi:predicted transposase YbfD/YdcC
MNIAGCLITVDAMGCQKEIAQKIVDQSADYLLALKGNQGKLHSAFKDYYDPKML